MLMLLYSTSYMSVCLSVCGCTCMFACVCVICTYIYYGNFCFSFLEKLIPGDFKQPSGTWEDDILILYIMCTINNKMRLDI